MDFLIQNAWAEATTSPSMGAPIFSLVLLLFAFWFLLIRPQTKRVKEHQRMVDSLGKGDEVVTNGGLLGKITHLGDNFVILEIAPNLEVKVQRHAISAVVPKGTLKNTL